MLVPKEKVEPDVGVQTTVGLASQRSEAIVLNVAMAPDGPVHSTTRLLLHMMAGAVVSKTVTVNMHALMLKRASRAVQLTVVMPIPKVEPEDGVHMTTGDGSQLSTTVVAKATIAPLGPAHSTVRLVLHMMLGAVASLTKTLAMHELEAPWLSTTVRVTNVSPSG